MPDGLRLALTLFTIAPLRAVRVDRRTARSAMIWAPAVGVLIALVVATVLFNARLIFADKPGPLLPAALALVTLAALTRGLHLDGLADTMDGLASHAPADRALEIMRSPEIGPLGMVSVLLSLLVQFTAIATCVENHRGTETVILGILAGRLAVLWSCLPSVPAARADGLGALVAGTVHRPVAALWTLAVAVEAALYGRLDQDSGTVRGMIRALAALAFALGITWLVRQHAVRRLGGITGDVLGALVEIGQVCVFLVMAIQLPYGIR